MQEEMQEQQKRGKQRLLMTTQDPEGITEALWIFLFYFIAVAIWLQYSLYKDTFWVQIRERHNSRSFL